MTTLDVLAWPVRAERVSLRPLTLDDADAVWAYRQLPEVCLWTGSHSPDFAAYEKRFLSTDRIGQTLVVEHDGRIIGDLMVKIEDGWAQREVAEHAVGVQAELGWAFDPAHAGQGLATEAVTALLGLCFDGLGLRRVTAFCFAPNEASSRLMDRIGMRRETHSKQESLHAVHGWVDSFGYALLADEWRAARGQGATIVRPGAG